jgi:hypothetical protein
MGTGASLDDYVLCINIIAKWAFRIGAAQVTLAKSTVYSLWQQTD